MQTRSFETWKVALDCGVCGACPGVEVTADAVTIGEEDNAVRLTHAQWNDLVARINKGELPKVPIHA